MARRSVSVESNDAKDADDVETPLEIPLPLEHRGVEWPEPTPEPAPPQRPLPDTEPRVVVDRFARGLPPALADAFMHVEKLHHGTRKLTLREWRAAYDRFLKVGR